MTDEETILDNEGEPLWMPKNSVRAILVLTTLFAGIALIFTQKSVPEWYVALLSGAFGFYFGVRSQE